MYSYANGQGKGAQVHSAPYIIKNQKLFELKNQKKKKEWTLLLPLQYEVQI